MSADIMFVCWGNICRSPMAQVVAEAHAAREGLTGITFGSAGVSAEEAGNPMDPRAVATLRAAGYAPGPFTAHRITADEARSAAMLIGMEELHLSRLRQLVPGAHNLYLMTDFDRDAIPGSGIEDPWYGDDEDFATALTQIEAAMPEVIKRAAELVRG
ncbi:low molecular weight protein-tyrosine-phosphatase [Propionicimonas sp. T2.31MG-18]|uniref:low molecular weight protein-tyrosine-phosphatase n=1 Tax=Propionicimonas sp. T2.31MG-18 TaxID=3157620 RepID=UPI00367067E8